MGENYSDSDIKDNNDDEGDRISSKNTFFWLEGLDSKDATLSIITG